MKDKIVVVGGGGHAKVIINVLKKLDNYKILGYTDLKDKGLVLGIKYLGTDEVLKNVIKTEKICNAVIAIGNIKISEVRQKIYEKINKLHFIFPVIISPNAIVNENVEIGKGSVVLDGAIINTSAQIGKFAIVNTNAIIEHDSRSSDFVHFAAGSILGGGATIGDNSLLGVGAKIIQYKNVGKNCLIGAGSVVIEDIKLEGTYFGVPARKISIS